MPVDIIGSATSLPLTVVGGDANGIFSIDLGPDRSGDVSMSGLLIKTGYNGSGGGGAIVNFDAGLTLLNCEVTGNASEGPGGGIAHYSARDLVLGGCVIEDNTAGLGQTGGGVYVNGGDFSLVACTVSGNSAGGDGGGVYIGGGTTGVQIDGSRVVGNSTSKGDGGGVRALAAVNVGYSEIAGNSAQYGGGISASGDLTVVNCTVSGNSATTSGGGLHQLGSGAQLALDNSTVAFNDADTGTGGGIFNDDATLRVTSSIISGNTGTDPDLHSGTDVYLYDSLVFGGAGWAAAAGSSGNIPTNTDPKLTTTLANNGGATRTHALKFDSPCLDVGDNTIGLDYDQRGEDFGRAVGLGTDMGAFELQRCPEVASLTTFADNANGFVADTHSRITRMVVVFTEPVTLPATPAAAFTLIQLSSGSPTVTLNATQSTDKLSVTLTFSGSLTESGDAYHSLVDGNYQLKITAADVVAFGCPLDGNGDGTAGDDYATASSGATALYRFFGDAQGNDRDVDVLDYNQFKAAYSGSGAVFDFDGDGSVDASDWGAFKQRFGSSLNTP